MTESEVDELSPTPQQANNWLPMLIVVALASLASVGAYFLYWQELAPKPESEPAQVTIETSIPTKTPEAFSDTSPTIPQQQTESQQRAALPALTESDDFLRQHWPEMGLPENTQAWLSGDFIVQRAVGFIDGLANGALLRKLTPLATSTTLLPRSTFQASQGEDGLQLDQANFERYAAFTAFLISIKPAHLADLFHWLRPLLESAYGELGQPAEQFGNRVITGLELMLGTPDINSPITLKRESVYYQFADPALEALPDSQKLLLRMGPENRAVIKQWLTSLKQALLAET
jgi:hypothetical protein